MQQFIGQTINGYEFLDFISEGGFGAVYKAGKNNEIFAIKIFREAYVLREFKRHGENNNRIQREIDIIKSVSHSNLVKYVDSFTDEGNGSKNYFLVMELIEGKTLREVLQQKEKLDEHEALSLFKKISEGIDFLHNHKGEEGGIIHRDLKPENIIITNDNNIKIVDFGISKVIDFTSITSTGEIFGTGPYMSPEQITDSKNIDKRSDLYTLGVILYEMLTGEYPYDFQYQPELIEKIKNDPPIPPRRRFHTISNKIENLILRLLEKNPYQRYKNIKKVFNDTEELKSILKKEYDLSPRFILRLYDDKTVLQEYLERNHEFENVIFPANLQEHQKGLKKIIQENLNIKIIIDPATIRLAYDTYSETKGLVALPYAPKSLNVITPNYLNDYKKQKEYVKLVIDEQAKLEANILLSPFHYTHNSSVIYTPTSNPIAEWFDLDCKLVKESVDYKNSKDELREKELYAGICIKADSVSNEKNKKHLLNIFSSFDCDGYLVYADCIDNSTSEIVLYHYIKLLRDLQKYTGKPVIAGRVNSIGLGLLCVGITGFTSGTARFESFYEDLYKEASEAFNMGDRYYFPELLGTIFIKRKTPIKFDAIVNKVGKCDCFYCHEKSNQELIVAKNTKLHFLEKINEEVEHIKEIPKDKRISYFLERIDLAIANYKELPDVFKPEDYAHLKKWENVFNELNKENYV